MPNEAVYGRIGGNIRRVRKDRGLNQEDVARALDLTRTAVTNIETGRQGLQVHQLLIIADALSVTPQELLDLGSVSIREIGSSNAIPDNVPQNLASILSRFQNRIGT